MASGIETRMQDFFERQIAWFETLITELGTPETGLCEEELEGFIARRTIHDAKTKNFSEEFGGLFSEWSRATDISATDRSRVRSMAARADDLCEQLQTRFTEGILAVDSRTHALTRELAELRQGRDMLRKYRPEAHVVSEFMDRDA